MPASLSGRLVVAISSRALFDFEAENELFEGTDDRAYMALQQERLDEPAPRGVARVGVQFEIDVNGILHVLARDMKTGAQQVVEMKSAVDVADAEVQRMVEESVEHAFEDLTARRWIEAKLKAQEVLTAAQSGFAECGAELELAPRAQVESAIAELQAALATESPATHTGDVNRLKAVHAALDAATQPLADLLMDKAMEAMLRARGAIG